MPIFTCITTIRDSVDLKQVDAPDCEAALRLAIAALPYDDGAGPFDEELEWLLRTTSGEAAVEMLPVNGCRNTWFWLDGARYDPQYLTYVVQSDVS